MKYVNSILSEGETIQHAARFHWTYLALAIMLLIPPAILLLITIVSFGYAVWGETGDEFRRIIDGVILLVGVLFAINIFIHVSYSLDYRNCDHRSTCHS